MVTPKEFRLTYKRYIQKPVRVLGSDYEGMLYRKLILNHHIPGITIFRSYNPASDTYYFEMFNKRVHLATGFMYRHDLEEFYDKGYNTLSSDRSAIISSFTTEVTTGSTTANTITANAITVPTGISTTTNTINTTTKKDKTMNADYDAATIDSMIEELLQKKAALADIESRWKSDGDFNDGDVIVVEYAYSDDKEAKIYTAALLKTKVGWFTTLTNNLLGGNKYSSIVKFFEKIYVKKVTYLALSEGVEMFSTVAESDADADADA